METFDTTVRHMTVISRWPKCLSKKLPKYLSEKNQRYWTKCGTWNEAKQQQSPWFHSTTSAPTLLECPCPGQHGSGFTAFVLL